MREHNLQCFVYFIECLELPKPSLGDLTALKASVQKVRRENNPTMLSFTFEELCAFDTVSIELMPEKRGILLKHVEYEVSSQVNEAKFMGFYCKI